MTYPPGRVSAIENNLRLFAIGSDLLGGGETHQLLQYLYERFGPVTSFTGTYQADEWRLNINRRDPDSGELRAHVLCLDFCTVAAVKTFFCP